MMGRGEKGFCWPIRAVKSRHGIDAGSIQTLDAWFGSFAYSYADLNFEFQRLLRHGDRLGLMFGFVFAKNFDITVSRAIDH